PQNIMMTGEGVAKICDLGLAKSVRKDTKLTSTGYVNCTPTHASPEQAKGDRELDCRTDIYSLGITFYQLVTGKLPFQGNAPGDYFIKHATAPRVAPSEINPRVSRRVNDLILKMIEPEAERRPKTPGAVIEAIRDILSTPEKPSAAMKAPAEKGAAPPGPNLLSLAGVREAAVWDLAVSQRDGCAIFRLSGRLDDTFDEVMTRRLTEILNTRVNRIIVDLSGLRYMNSRGVSAFIAVVDDLRQKGGDLKMAGAKPQAKLVLERLGISLILQHLETVEEAVEAFKTTPVYSASAGTSSDEVITLPPEMILGIERASGPASGAAVPEPSPSPPVASSPAASEGQPAATPALQPETGKEPGPVPAAPPTRGCQHRRINRLVSQQLGMESWCGSWRAPSCSWGRRAGLWATFSFQKEPSTAARLSGATRS
ncbi:MAG TPA: STAS domain-containing protein, partial [Planctomycetota bacterium]|nr:STAS domain-containing protein [Planctomycetota bacterium]